MRSLRLALAVSAVALTLGLFGSDLRAERMLQYGFEAHRPVWRADRTDGAYKELVHELTGETAHGGLKSEHIRVQIERGTYLHYVYPIPKALVTDDLLVSLWLKSNRPNVQLLCRIVFPNERDPQDLSRNLTALVRCEEYQSTRWKLINLPQPLKRLREQQQLLTKLYKGKEINVKDAYVDQLVLNVCDGTGVIDVWTDDLEIGPVSGPDPTITSVEPGDRNDQSPTAVSRSSEVKLVGGHLKVGDKRFLMRGIRHSGTPLRTLRDVGLNTIWLDESASAATIDEAANLGFWMVPSLRPLIGQGPGNRVEGQLTSGEAFNRLTSRFIEKDAVLAWYLGTDLSTDQYERVMRLAEAFRAADPQRPVIADVWDGSMGISRSLHGNGLIGTHRWPLYTSLELTAYREWLENRRRLTTNNYSWTWVQTHLPDWYDRVAYDGDASRSLADGAGPQPEQIRLLTYCALAAGYRGVSFWSDRYLADNRKGRDRLLALALLNQELRLLEPILTQATSEVEWVSTSRPEVFAAVFRSPQGTLVLPMWVGPGSQYVPGQAAATELQLTIPVAITSTAWEVTPGRIQSLKIKRVQGGCQVSLRNFSLTSAVLFASDLGPRGLVVQLQEKQRTMGRLAAQWLCDQAKEELDKVQKTWEQIDAGGHSLPDARELLTKARASLEKAQRLRRDGEHAEAYGAAEVALRSLRVLMRTHWDRAVRDLDSPVASPYAGSFFTLPRHWQLLDQLKQMHVGASLLTNGDFELPPEEVQPNWLLQEAPTLDPIESVVRRVLRPLDAPKPPVRGLLHVRGKSSEEEVTLTPPARGGKQCLMIEVKQKDLQTQLGVLEKVFVAVHSPAVRLRPGSLVRISAWIKTDGVSGSIDGALFYDSVGGEPLAVRTQREMRWKRYALYRRVPESGLVSVTLATTGLGKVFFDDVRIEPLE